MNEQLKNIVEQASDESNYGLECVTDAFLEKFAELIVRECIDIVSPYAIRMENFDGGHPIDDLKKHFGVEE